METIKNSITINVPKDKVWTVLTEHPYVDDWNGEFMGGSTVKGDFVLNGELLYQGADGGGMKTVVKEFEPGKRMVIVGTASLKSGGEELKEGDEGYDDYKEWIGSTDTYELSETDGQTTLNVTTTIPDPNMVDMFNESWAKSLEKIKQLAENA